MQMLRAGLSDVEFGEAAGAHEALKKINEQAWDMMILDMEMPGQNGLQVLRQLKDEKIKINTLVFSAYPEDQVAVRAFKAGAHGYLPKSASRQELSDAAELILNGRKYFTLHSAELIARQVTEALPAFSPGLLSDREFSILLLLAKGKTLTQVAKALFLSISTISTLRHRILIKLGIKNNAELIQYAMRNNLT